MTDLYRKFRKPTSVEPGQLFHIYAKMPGARSVRRVSKSALPLSKAQKEVERLMFGKTGARNAFALATRETL